MLRILVPIVSSLILSSSLYAIEIPIVQNLEVTIPLKELSVIEFPFEVKVKNFTPFVYKKKKTIQKDVEKKDFDPLKDSVKLPQVKDLTPLSNIRNMRDIKKKITANKNAVVNTLKGKSKKFSVSWGKNFVQFLPKKEGSTQLIVWGYEKFPIIIKIIISNDKELSNSYIKFVDYEADNKKITKKSLKNTSHEKVCSRLIKSLYNHKVPSGYKTVIKVQEYNSKSLEVSFVKSIVGKYYTASEYRVLNIADTALSLNEPMFSTANNYAISIENRDLKENEATRMFVVTPSDKE